MLAAGVSVGAVGRGWRFIESQMETSGQVPVRLTVLLLFGLVVMAAQLGLDVILGAFAAGAILRLLLRGREVERFESKLDAVGFGLLIPFFFVTSGMELDLSALTGSTRAMIELPVFLLLFLLVRGVPALLLALPANEIVMTAAGSGWSGRALWRGSVPGRRHRRGRSGRR